MKQLISIIAGLIVIGCASPDVVRPIGGTEIPAQITIRDVIDGPGQSIVYFNIPDDDNLKYIKASYSPRPGTEINVNASAFTDSLVLDGFSDVGEYKVKLYSVSFGETYSEPVNIIARPTLPPYKIIAENAEVTGTFGGVSVAFENPTKAALAVTVMRLDSLGVWNEQETHYTSSPSVFHSFHGMDAVPTKFRLRVTNHWGDIAESSDFDITPLFEELCDKSKFRGLRLAGDMYSIAMWGGASNNNSLECCFDGSYYTGAPIFQTGSNDPMPICYTIDLGQKYQLSRHKHYPCLIFQGGHPRIFEVYGASELNPDSTVPLVDALGNVDPYWTLLGSFESFRPSGYTISSQMVPCTAEDIAHCENGEQFNFPNSTPAVRYVRFRVLRTWDGTRYVEVPEIDLFGAPENR